MVITCGNCGVRVEAVTKAQTPPIFWLQCPSCGDGSVRVKSGVVYPPAPAGGTIKNLPDDVAKAWREARTAHAVAAYTAAEMMLRKILMHVAVDVAGSKSGEQFLSYVDDLEGAGYITPRLKPVIDKLRRRGNIANHELPASTEDDSLTTLTITEYLLRGIYEMPGLATP